MLEHGIYAIFKPPGITSHDVINQVRKISGEKRVGHAGTLDPFAEGVLVVAIGREFTKQLATHVESDKEYIATVRLGYTSTTDDPEGEISEYNTNIHPSKSEVEGAVQKFIGEIEQTPPIYSAIKVNGKPAHRRVRRGEEVKLKSRVVQVFSITIEKYLYPELVIKVQCGKGVYIRALARDIGKELETGGYLTKLVRTKVGKFELKAAIHL